MKVLLLQLDGLKLPNLALARIAHWHMERGDEVQLRRVGNASALEPRLGDAAFDKIYGSLIFTDTRQLAERARQVYPQIELGGTGWDLARGLDDIGIDGGSYALGYSLFPKFRAVLGFTQRGCRLSCDFCVVPEKEGKPIHANTVAELRQMALASRMPGDDKIDGTILLDNDFFGGPHWIDRHAELVATNEKVDLTQGINARALNNETALAMSQLNYRATNLRDRRIYTAWDNIGHEKPLMRGLELLASHGVKPDHIMVYMLIGHRDSHADREHRRRQIRAFGARPYPMPFKRTPELVGFQRWVIGAYDKRIPWEQWAGAKFSPRKLGDRVSLPLFEPAEV